MIAVVESAATRSAARMALQKVRCSGKEREALQSLLSCYESVREATGKHDLALYIASCEALRIVGKSDVRSYAYPKGPSEILPKLSEDEISSYITTLNVASKPKVQDIVSTITFNGNSYVFGITPIQTQLVGLDKEWNILEKTLRQLFLYNPSTCNNIDSGLFSETICLSGPPGSGKSSLLGKVISEARHLESVASLRCAVEIFDASNYSSYFGRSARNMRSKLQKCSDPLGVGIFCIEDADMVLQSRDDGQVYHGLQQVQQYLMNHLSGIEKNYGNMLTFLTTNRAQNLDSAILSRIRLNLLINPFSVLENHTNYWKKYFSLQDAQKLASVTHQAGFSGRDLESVLSVAKSNVTRAPTNTEIRDKIVGDRQGTPTYENVAALIAERKVALHS